MKFIESSPDSPALGVTSQLIRARVRFSLEPYETRPTFSVWLAFPFLWLIAFQAVSSPFAGWWFGLCGIGGEGRQERFLLRVGSGLLEFFWVRLWSADAKTPTS